MGQSQETSANEICEREKSDAIRGEKTRHMNTTIDAEVTSYFGRGKRFDAADFTHMIVRSVGGRL